MKIYASCTSDVSIFPITSTPLLTRLHGSPFLSVSSSCCHNSKHRCLVLFPNNPLLYQCHWQWTSSPHFPSIPSCANAPPPQPHHSGAPSSCTSGGCLASGNRVFQSLLSSIQHQVPSPSTSALFLHCTIGPLKRFNLDLLILCLILSASKYFR